MRTNRRDDEFTAYVAVSRDALRQLAYVICGDWHLAEDLVQTSLSKLYVAWHRVDGDPERYVRRILVNAHRDHLRRPFRRREAQVLDQVPEPVVDERDASGRHDVVGALRSLPLSMRHVLALRYFEDMSVRDTALTLGCSEGNVKSQTARGLAHLERVLTPSSTPSAKETP